MAAAAGVSTSHSTMINGGVGAPRRQDDPMRTIGLLGGMSWESSALYYRLLNEAVRDRLGGLHSAR